MNNTQNLKSIHFNGTFLSNNGNRIPNDHQKKEHIDLASVKTRRQPIQHFNPNNLVRSKFGKVSRVDKRNPRIIVHSAKIVRLTSSSLSIVRNPERNESRKQVMYSSVLKKPKPNIRSKSKQIGHIAVGHNLRLPLNSENVVKQSFSSLPDARGETPISVDENYIQIFRPLKMCRSTASITLRQPKTSEVENNQSISETEVETKAYLVNHDQDTDAHQTRSDNTSTNLSQCEIKHRSSIVNKDEDKEIIDCKTHEYRPIPPAVITSSKHGVDPLSEVRQKMPQDVEVNQPSFRSHLTVQMVKPLKQEKEATNKEEKSETSNLIIDGNTRFSSQMSGNNAIADTMIMRLASTHTLPIAIEPLHPIEVAEQQSIASVVKKWFHGKSNIPSPDSISGEKKMISPVSSDDSIDDVPPPTPVSRNYKVTFAEQPNFLFSVRGLSSKISNAEDAKADNNKLVNTDDSKGKDEVAHSVLTGLEEAIITGKEPGKKEVLKYEKVEVSEKVAETADGVLGNVEKSDVAGSPKSETDKCSPSLPKSNMIGETNIPVIGAGGNSSKIKTSSYIETPCRVKASTDIGLPPRWHMSRMDIDVRPDRLNLKLDSQSTNHKPAPKINKTPNPPVEVETKVQQDLSKSCDKREKVVKECKHFSEGGTPNSKLFTPGHSDFLKRRRDFRRHHLEMLESRSLFHTRPRIGQVSRNALATLHDNGHGDDEYKRRQRFLLKKKIAFIGHCNEHENSSCIYLLCCQHNQDICRKRKTICSSTTVTFPYDQASSISDVDYGLPRTRQQPKNDEESYYIPAHGNVVHCPCVHYDHDALQAGYNFTNHITGNQPSIASRDLHQEGSCDQQLTACLHFHCLKSSRVSKVGDLHTRTEYPYHNENIHDGFPRLTVNSRVQKSHQRICELTGSPSLHSNSVGFQYNCCKDDRASFPTPHRNYDGISSRIENHQGRVQEQYKYHDGSYDIGHENRICLHILCCGDEEAGQPISHHFDGSSIKCHIPGDDRRSVGSSQVHFQEKFGGVYVTGSHLDAVCVRFLCCEHDVGILKGCLKTGCSNACRRDRREDGAVLICRSPDNHTNFQELRKQSEKLEYFDFNRVNKSGLCLQVQFCDSDNERMNIDGVKFRNSKCKRKTGTNGESDSLSCAPCRICDGLKTRDRPFYATCNTVNNSYIERRPQIKGEATVCRCLSTTNELYNFHRMASTTVGRSHPNVGSSFTDNQMMVDNKASTNDGEGRYMVINMREKNPEDNLKVGEGKMFLTSVYRKEFSSPSVSRVKCLTRRK